MQRFAASGSREAHHKIRLQVFSAWAMSSGKYGSVLLDLLHVRISYGDRFGVRRQSPEVAEVGVLSAKLHPQVPSMTFIILMNGWT